MKAKDTDFLTASAIDLARRIRRGECSSTEVVEAHIQQIERVNPGLNAVVHNRFSQAREEARLADERRGTAHPEELPALHGVPCTVKECFAMTGMPNTGGVVTRAGVVAQSDATAVRRVRDAGAIVLGVTNLSEGCMWMESNNRVYGRTNNPYDPARMVGGSSGGEGAIIGAGGSPFGLGSDIGGSIRLPAFFNGVFGHKPTGGLVPGSGQWPIAENQALRYLTTGPLTRRAEDLWPLLGLLAGPDGIDTGAYEMELGEPESVAIDELDVVYVPDNGTRISAELTVAHRGAARALESMGARVREVRIDRLRRSFEIWSQLLGQANDTAFRQILGGSAEKALARELGRWALRRSDNTLPALLLAVLEDVTALLPAPDGLQELADELYDELVREIGPNGVMLFPTFSRPAPRHYFAMLVPFHAGYTAIFNTLEMPATAVPLGLSPTKGVPLGLQVVGRRGADHLTIATAMALERAIGGWTPPWQS